ncbi:hypothetical protein LF1_41550 [Rubripirellula obstinata]|uniref:Uncharacterized protein n=1 Tax=Rubripirellula obstinata TaxID=406547 RepID=A0A5B1CQT6_9BACT|nr:hypothetical protein [Rubripirellula obstinata]KAA1261604.1 hypothetical protein LF1_41550 [Rubripirellula obstinata]
MTIDSTSGSYSFDDIYENKLDDCYRFYDDFAGLLARALSYVSYDDADRILESAFFVPYYGDSWHISPSLIQRRSFIIIDAKDLEDADDAIVTILHEAGHAYLQHGTCSKVSTELMRQQEDECWALVRRWLPDSFGGTIDHAERLGSGSQGNQQ